MPISIAGSGTITGISVGGIPDGVVDTDVLAANAVTYARSAPRRQVGLQSLGELQRHRRRGDPR
jgi:hypothetical protein